MLFMLDWPNVSKKEAQTHFCGYSVKLFGGLMRLMNVKRIQTT